MIKQLDVQLIQPAMKKACPILDILLQAGFSAYFVGGAVRDTLLRKPIHDIDIATSAKPEELLELFPHCIPTGLQHGTVTVLHDEQSYEITTFRAETGYQDFRHPTEIAFVQELEQDLQRRDFTMNAMAIDRDWQLYDPFGGLLDLHNGILATVGTSRLRFQEDALRMLRAVRFAATYQLRIESSCQLAIWEHGELLKYIAMERVSYELSRMLQADDPAAAIALLHNSKLLQHTKTSLHLANGTFCEQPYISNRKEQTNWALLFMYSGLTEEEAVQDMRALKLSNKLRDEALKLLQLSHWFYSQNEQQLEQQWIEKLLDYPRHVLDLWLEQFAPLGTNMVKLARFDRELPIKNMKQLKVTGKQLLQWCDAPAGPWVKILLNELFIAVVKGKIANDKQELQKYVEAWKEG